MLIDLSSIHETVKKIYKEEGVSKIPYGLAI